MTYTVHTKLKLQWITDKKFNAHMDTFYNKQRKLSVIKGSEFTINNIIIILLVVYPVADPGFLEGGFCYTVAREARAKFWKPRPFLSAPRPFRSF